MNESLDEIMEEIRGMRADIAALSRSLNVRAESVRARCAKIEQDMQVDTEFMQKRTYELLKRSNRLHMLEFLR